MSEKAEARANEAELLLAQYRVALDAGQKAELDAAETRLEAALAALRYWFAPCSETDPMTHLDALITFLDAWDEKMLTRPAIQVGLREWRVQALAALTAPVNHDEYVKGLEAALRKIRSEECLPGEEWTSLAGRMLAHAIAALTAPPAGEAQE